MIRSDSVIVMIRSNDGGRRQYIGDDGMMIYVNLLAARFFLFLGGEARQTME